MSSGPEKKLWKNCNRFSEKLAQRILQSGLNGQKLARKSEVSDSEISRILNGKSLPGLENAIALARAVDVSLDFLADDALDLDPGRPQVKEPANEIETTILALAREIGPISALTILANVRSLGFEMAQHRLVDAKPVVTPLVEVASTPTPARGVSNSPPAVSRVSSAG
jgi:transcriptional regulator with XRE-family HTH domain